MAAMLSVGYREGIWNVISPATAIPKSVLVGTDLSWSNCRKVRWLKKSRVRLDYYKTQKLSSHGLV